MSSAVVVFVSLCGLLVAGKFVRIKVPLLQRLYLPSSGIGGAMGLVVISLSRDAIDPDALSAIRRVPGFLINVVFVTLFLGTRLPNFRRVLSLAFPQLVLGQIMAWGQYVVGLGLSMVHSIVEFYNGKIDCDSTPNSGTTFDILFPPPRNLSAYEKA